MDYITELRKYHATSFLTLSKNYGQELRSNAPLAEVARDHFMEALERVVQRGPTAKIADEIDDLLLVIGASCILSDVCKHGTDEEMEVLNDALRFAATHVLSNQQRDSDAGAA